MTGASNTLISIKATINGSFGPEFRWLSCHLPDSGHSLRHRRPVELGSLLPFAAFANNINVKSEGERLLCGRSGHLLRKAPMSVLNRPRHTLIPRWISPKFIGHCKLITSAINKPPLPSSNFATKDDDLLPTATADLTQYS